MGKKNGETTDPPLFERLGEKQTNIGFQNTLTEKPTPHQTELLYEYFTNGGGVAVGDLNGDGRDDLYFTGNMRYNALYLNEGEMTFRKVSRKAGVRGRKNTWNTGASMADVNGDGLLDLYVCYSGELPLKRRVDELYINQGTGANGVPRFEERAANYGLDHPHSSNQSYFFDYDRDGDLDLYLQTHNVKTLPRGNPRSIQQKLAQTDSVNGNRFYENQGGTFVDVTGEVGIQSSPLTYGLGAGVSDVNKDGWPDIYVGNDYSPPDYLYINNGDGTFTNTIRKSMGHISRASMGVDVADVNNDRFADIFVLDMIAEGNRRQKLLHIPNDRKVFEKRVQSGFHHQYTVNTLHLNNGNGTFSEVAQLAGVSNTDWSWSPLIADYDNDGWKDIFVSNGILHDITNRDFLRFRRQFVQKRNYDLQPKDIGLLMKKMPSEDVENYAFENREGKRFAEVSSEWGLGDPVITNGAAYSDLNGDGDLDLITNNINEHAYVYENRTAQRGNAHYLDVRLRGATENTYGIGTKVTLFADSTRQYLEQFPTRGYLSSVSPVLHFGLGPREIVDSLRVVWPDGRTQTLAGVETNQTLTLRQENAVDDDLPSRSDSTHFRPTDPPFEFRHRMTANIDDFRRQPLMVNAKSFGGPALATADVNGDGRKDVFVGGGNSQASVLYLQRQDGSFTLHSQAAFQPHRASNAVDALFFDYDGDGDEDLYVANGGYGGVAEDDPALQDRLYVNDGTGTFTAASKALPQMRTSTGVVTSTDVNGDGRPDLFVGGRVVPGRYPHPPRSYLLIYGDDGRFVDRTAERASDLREVGMVTDAEWHDLNGTGTQELIVVGEWMPITVFGNEGGTLSKQTNSYFQEPQSGFWYSVELFPIGGGNRLGILAGNLGGNTQIRATKSEPAELFYDDFDRDGRPDPIFSYYIDGTRYPHVLLDRLREAVPSLGARFSNYEEYANATLSDLLTEKERRQAGHLQVDRLETSLFVSGSGGQFKRRSLPMEAQFSPVYSIEVLDYNDDGTNDLLLAGNMSETRIRFPKYDANHGMLMKGNGRGGFEYVPQWKSGFALKGDVRAISTIQGRLLFGVNRGEVTAYRPGPVDLSDGPIVRGQSRER